MNAVYVFLIRVQESPICYYLSIRSVVLDSIKIVSLSLIPNRTVRSLFSSLSDRSQSRVLLLVNAFKVIIKVIYDRITNVHRHVGTSRYHVINGHWRVNTFCHRVNITTLPWNLFHLFHLSNKISWFRLCWKYAFGKVRCWVKLQYSCSTSYVR